MHARAQIIPNIIESNRGRTKVAAGGRRRSDASSVHSEQRVACSHSQLRERAAQGGPRREQRREVSNGETPRRAAARCRRSHAHEQRAPGARSPSKRGMRVAAAAVTRSTRAACANERAARMGRTGHEKCTAQQQREKGARAPSRTASSGAPGARATRPSERCGRASSSAGSREMRSCERGARARESPRPLFAPRGAAEVCMSIRRGAARSPRVRASEARRSGSPMQLACACISDSRAGWESRPAVEAQESARPRLRRGNRPGLQPAPAICRT